MAHEIDKRASGCPVAFALDVFGDRWTLLVIRDMLLHGKRSYSEFMESEEHIASNILVSRLKQLEAEGIAVKTRDPENHRRFLYDLTEKGRDLVPVLLEMIRWSGRHDPRPAAQREVPRLIEADRPGLEARLRAGGEV